MPSPRFLPMALVAAAILLLPACTGPSDGVGPSGAPAGPPVQGGEVRINMRTEPDTIDPNQSSFATSVLIASQVFEGLLSYDKDLKLIPAVAKEVPSIANSGISSDGK